MTFENRGQAVRDLGRLWTLLGCNLAGLLEECRTFSRDGEGYLWPTGEKSRKE